MFSSARACVAAALEMQRALGSHRWPGGAQVRVRMGMHAGEAEQTTVGLVGVEVHRAARVAAVGYGGQVLVLEAAAVLVRDALLPGASLTDLGVHRLKDLGRPERIFQLQAAGLSARFPLEARVEVPGDHPAVQVAQPVEVARGHGLIWTAPDADTGIHGSEGRCRNRTSAIREQMSD